MKRAAKIRIGTYFTVFDLSASFTLKIKILCFPITNFVKSGYQHKILIFTVKEALKSKTVNYVPILIFTALFISDVKIPNFENFVTRDFVTAGYVIGIENRRDGWGYFLSSKCVKISELPVPNG